VHANGKRTSRGFTAKDKKKEKTEGVTKILGGIITLPKYRKQQRVKATVLRDTNDGGLAGGKKREGTKCPGIEQVQVSRGNRFDTICDRRNTQRSH